MFRHVLDNLKKKGDIAGMERKGWDSEGVLEDWSRGRSTSLASFEKLEDSPHVAAKIACNGYMNLNI